MHRRAGKEAFEAWNKEGPSLAENSLAGRALASYNKWKQRPIGPFEENDRRRVHVSSEIFKEDGQDAKILISALVYWVEHKYEGSKDQSNPDRERCSEAMRRYRTQLAALLVAFGQKNAWDSRNYEDHQWPRGIRGAKTAG